VSESRRCLYCQGWFLPSRYRPQEPVCSRPDCQSRRRADSSRQHLATDTKYEVARDRRKKWRKEHPDYQKLY
jgi:hypothetical protein